MRVWIPLTKTKDGHFGSHMHWWFLALAWWLAAATPALDAASPRKFDPLSARQKQVCADVVLPCHHAKARDVCPALIPIAAGLPGSPCPHGGVEIQCPSDSAHEDEDEDDVFHHRGPVFVCNGAAGAAGAAGVHGVNATCSSRAINSSCSTLSCTGMAAPLLICNGRAGAAGAAGATGERGPSGPCPRVAVVPAGESMVCDGHGGQNWTCDGVSSIVCNGAPGVNGNSSSSCPNITSVVASTDCHGDPALVVQCGTAAPRVTCLPSRVSNTTCNCNCTAVAIPFHSTVCAGRGGTQIECSGATSGSPICHPAPPVCPCNTTTSCGCNCTGVAVPLHSSACAGHGGTQLQCNGQPTGPPVCNAAPSCTVMILVHVPACNGPGFNYSCPGLPTLTVCTVSGAGATLAASFAFASGTLVPLPLSNTSPIFFTDVADGSASPWTSVLDLPDTALETPFASTVPRNGTLRYLWINTVATVAPLLPLGETLTLDLVIRRAPVGGDFDDTALQASLTFNLNTIITNQQNNVQDLLDHVAVTAGDRMVLQVRVPPPPASLTLTLAVSGGVEFV